MKKFALHGAFLGQPGTKLAQHAPLTGSTGTKLALHGAFLGQPGTKLAQHAIKRRFSAIFRALGEFSHAQADNKPSRATFFTHRTQPRGNCETAITTATADADQHETTITTATEKQTQNTHFSPAKAMVVSSEARLARAKATPVSRERFVMPTGYGGAWPGTESTHRATHQRPGATGVEGAGGTGGHGRASRSTLPSRRLACGDLAGGRARRRPEHQRSRKQQAQSRIPAAPPAWRAPEGARGPGCGAGGWRGLAAVPVGGGRARAGLEIDHSERSSRVAISRAGRRPPARTAAGPTSSARTLRGIATARHSKRGRHQPTPCASALTHP